jgi:hypothetical protein
MGFIALLALLFLIALIVIYICIGEGNNNNYKGNESSDKFFNDFMLYKKIHHKPPFDKR